MMNTKGQSKNVLVGLIVVLIVIAGLGVGLNFYGQQQEQALIEEIADVDTAEGEIPSGLLGKAAVVSVYAYDKASNSPSSTKLATQLYMLQNPTVDTATQKVGEDFAADGTTLSTSTRTDITAGLAVGDTFIAIANNATTLGVWSEEFLIQKQPNILDLKSYTLTTTVDIILKDEDDDIIAVDAEGINLTLVGSAEETFNSLKIKNTVADSAYRLAGFYIDIDENSNMSSFTGTGITIGQASVSWSKVTDFSLENTGKDDFMFVLAEPVLLLEYDFLTFEGLTVKADGDGCAALGIDIGDFFTIYAFDKVWDKSNKISNTMNLVAETDADSPADLGLADVSEKYGCDAGA